MWNTVINVNKQIFNKYRTNRRNFYYWLIMVFNGVDQSRVEQVGPDRACAEWLLRNGAAVFWKGRKEFLSDYNALPDENERFYITAIDATDSAIHHIGFPHFHGCKYIEDIKLVRCSYIEDKALPLLEILKDTLKDLEVIECKNITDNALLELKKLTGLKTLKLGGMPYVKDKNHVMSELTAALPKCKITYE